ncbi:MAG: arsenosugar biosynthesis radical SAM (seleno)protein ArsS [Bacteroidota bacterium]
MAIKQKGKSLKSRASDLSNTFIQLEVLNGRQLVDEQFEPFAAKLANLGHAPLKPASASIFQMNVGKMCNMTCAHCHVDAGPDRKEIMTRATMERCLELIDHPEVQTVDITGGAPEMNPHFRWFVEEVSALGKQIIDRCNLTIIMANKKYHDLPDFFAKHKVNVVSSLPYFSKTRTDAQRGDGVFSDSIKALKKLNEVGYGQPDTGLQLDLVYNPTGAFLPGDQNELELEFKRQLKRRFDIDFNMLFAITNIPISRFLDYLLESNNYKDYMTELVNAFNPSTVEGLMCRHTISVGWDGYLYDCDFNQMLELKVTPKHSQHVDSFDWDAILNRNIILNQHCYGCTAGAGSSCGGELV